MRSPPITRPTMTAPRARQQFTLDQHYDTTLKVEAFPIQTLVGAIGKESCSGSKSLQMLWNKCSIPNRRNNKSNLKQGKI